MADIGSILAQSGSVAGQQIGSGFQGILTNVGGMLQGRADKQRKEAEAQNVQNLLQENSADQAKLIALGQKYASEGNDKIAKLFFDAAAMAKENAKDEAAAQAKEQTSKFVSGLGEEYAQLYGGGMPLKDVYQQYLSDNQDTAIRSVIDDLDLDVPAGVEITPDKLVSLMNDKKKSGGEKSWAKWIKENKGEITDDNRASAMEAALDAFGADGPAKVVELEAKQLANKEKRSPKKNKEVEVLVVLKTDMATDPLSGKQTKLTKIKLAVDENGQFTKKSQQLLEEYADHAYAAEGDIFWKSKGSDNNDTILGSPSGQGGVDGGTTLGTLVGPEVMNQALSNIEF